MRRRLLEEEMLKAKIAIVCLSGLLLLPALAHSAAGYAESAKTRLVGTWRLVSRVVAQNGKAIQDPTLGDTPTGYLMYDSAGHMAVQLMRQNRPADSKDCAQVDAAPRNNTQSVNGYDAYFGTYTVDEKNGTVTHHLEGALVKSDIGKDLVRHFEVSEDKLVLMLTTDSSAGPQTRTLTWERIKQQD
jgi:hypothetical protein